MEADGYFVDDEIKKELEALVMQLLKEEYIGKEYLATTLTEIIGRFERVYGNADTEAERAGRDLHFNSMGLWDADDNSPKVDVAAKLKARLLTRK